MRGPEQDLSKMPPLREQMVAGANWIAWICQVLEASVAVFLRRGFGSRYLGGQAAAVYPAVLIFTLFWKGHDVRPLFWFLGLYTLGCLKARIGGLLARRRGVIAHSYYSGEPGVMRWRMFKGKLTEEAAKGRVEPLCVFLIGLLLMPTSEPLGAYLMLASMGLGLSVGMAIAYDKKRIMDMRDAYIAQRADAKRFRDAGWH